jgi:nucleotide-binding universal stress UspA family protein
MAENMEDKIRGSIGAQFTMTVQKTIFGKILVAVDGSENSNRAAQLGLDIAERFKSEVTVIHCISTPTGGYMSTIPSLTLPSMSQTDIDKYYAVARKAALAILGQTVTNAQKRRIPVKSETKEAVTSTVETIVNYADSNKMDLIIVGTRGLGGFKKMLLGSVSSGIVSHAHCPVLVVR